MTALKAAGAGAASRDAHAGASGSTAAPAKDRKRKVVIYVAYVGAGYSVSLFLEPNRVLKQVGTACNRDVTQHNRLAPGCRACRPILALTPSRKCWKRLYTRPEGSQMTTHMTLPR